MMTPLKARRYVTFNHGQRRERATFLMFAHTQFRPPPCGGPEMEDGSP